MMRAMFAAVPPTQPATRPFVGFLMVGTGGFVVDAGVLSLYLCAVPGGFLTGRLVSFFVAVTFTWYLNRSFTFRVTDRPTFREWARFVAVNLLGGGANFVIYSLLVSHSEEMRAWPILAVAAGAVVGLIVNFLGASRIVFRQASPRCRNEDRS
jgi:putative flippase GtrA